MLSIYGKRYVIEHIVSEYRKAQKAKRYKTYVTDALKLLIEIGATFVGCRLDVPRFSDEDKASCGKTPKEEKTAKEVIDGIKEKLRRM